MLLLLHLLWLLLLLLRSLLRWLLRSLILTILKGLLLRLLPASRHLTLLLIALLAVLVPLLPRVKMHLEGLADFLPISLRLSEVVGNRRQGVLRHVLYLHQNK